MIRKAHPRGVAVLGLIPVTAMFVVGCRYEKRKTVPTAAGSGNEWQSLFDGKTLEGWETVQFGGEGEVHAGDGNLVLSSGWSLTGVVRTGGLPQVPYEITLEAMRSEGKDIFCGLTFPLRDSWGREASASLVVGGWGGGVCGISSLNDQDASENETTTYREFENGRWYRVRLQVTEKRIAAWLDSERIVEVETAGRRIDTRIEMDLLKPLGLASWQTTAKLRKLQWRRLKGEE